MSRGGWKSMMRVVPAFTHPEDAEQGIVPALIIAVIGLRTPYVADRVDAPGNMVNEKDSHQSAPDESSPRPTWRSDEQPAKRRWNE